MKKLLCSFLVSVLLLGSLAACADTSDTPKDTTPSASTDSAESESTATREPLEVPETNYSTTITFLTRDEQEWTTLEIYSEGLTQKSDNINDSVYERNLLIKSKYGVTIEEMKVPLAEHNNAITKEISGQAGDFQAIITNTAQSTDYASQGMLWDLNDEAVTYMDFTKSWWDTNMAEGMSIHDRLYFATGDLLTADNDATFLILFNKDIAANNQLPNLYNMVDNNEWTMEKLYQYAEISKKEVNGNDSLQYDKDIAGLAYTESAPACFLLGSGVTLCVKDSTDTPAYALNIERAENTAEMGKKLFNSAYSIDLTKFTDASLMEIGKTCFGGGHALFLSECMQTVTRMRSYDVNFGVLPIPMYDTQQGAYYSMMHMTASMVSIPKTVAGEQLTMVSAIIEAMAYYSVDTLTIQYYDINLKTKGAKDEQSGPMIDKILDSRICDLAYYFGWSGAFSGVASTLLPTSTGAVSSMNAQYKTRLNRTINELVDKLDDMADN